MSTSAQTVGRAIGAILLTQLIVAPVANFRLMRSITTPPGFLANAAGSAGELRLAVLLAFVAGGLTLGVAVVAAPLFRRYSERLSLLYLALALLGCATVASENVAVLNMLALSEAHAKPGADSALFAAPAVILRSARNAAHYTNVLTGGLALTVLYIILLRFRLVPRALAGFGLAAAAIQVVTLTTALLGRPIELALMIPVGLSQLALIVWLLVRGFREHRAEVGQPLPA